MNRKERIEKIEEFAKKTMDCPGHNIDHVMRVYNLCLNLAKGEKINHDVLEAATLLHDIGGLKEMKDKTGKTDHAIESSKMAKPILEKLGYDSDEIEHIQECIVSHRFKTDNKPRTLEAKLLFDADKLDALGAIGVARHFVWVGKNNAHIYRKVKDINEYLKKNMTGGSIGGRIMDKSEHSPQIEYEIKIKYIINKLYTKKAKRIAKERLKFFEKFLDRLEREVQGKM